MPVIAFVSPKGGAGKSTSAVILATELAEELGEEGSVAIIDADPNRPVSQWATRAGQGPRLAIPHDSGSPSTVGAVAALHAANPPRPAPPAFASRRTAAICQRTGARKDAASLVEVVDELCEPAAL